jgi:hypothetical protein
VFSASTRTHFRQEKNKRSVLPIILTLSLLIQFFQIVEASAVPAGTGNCVQNVDTATGVTVQEIGTECIVTFNVSSQATTVTNGWTAPTGVTSVRVLVVGGGGSGDRGQCGVLYGHGGGGGQVREGVIPVQPSTSYQIQVGRGGQFAWSTGCPEVSGVDGADSAFGSVISYGGKGAIFNVSTGGDSGSRNYAGETRSTNLGAGGGAGAGGAAGSVALKGGIGVNSSITNSEIMYGSGGAGRDNTGGGAAFSGGASGTTSAIDNRGGGGTDPIGTNGPQNGAAGVVVIRYTFVATCLPTETRNDSATVLTFSSLGTCNWQVPDSVTALNVLLVGGGGGGGTWVAGGGGGGGVTEQRANVSAGNTYSISVGAGGQGSLAMGGTALSQGTNGGESKAFGLTAYGGGLGASWTSYVTGSAATGGGGGTASGTGSAATPDASITPTQGFSGGAGSGVGGDGFPSGGGGGAGGVGGSAVGKASGSGGAGKSSSITGSSVVYGGGGGGGCHGNEITGCTNGNGTNGGGNGSGYVSTSPATGFLLSGGAGTANTGGGGGGAGIPFSLAYNHALGGTGGSGIVIVSFVRTISSDNDFALSLNGTNQYADVADSTGSAFDITGTITLEAWVYPSSSCSTAGAVISKRSYLLYCEASVWKVMFLADGMGGSGVTTNISVRANEWQHIAVTKSSSSGDALFYFNGNLASTVATGVTAMTPNNVAFEVGRYSAISSFRFQGQIDEVKLWNSVRSAVQIQDGMHSRPTLSDSNLKAYYNFNEGQGTKVFNFSGSALSSTDLTIANAAPFVADSITATTSSGPYSIQSFYRSLITANGGWKVPSGVSRVRSLVVAGGGGGGNDEGGGGGGGGFIDSVALTLTPNNFAAVKVGQGGIGANGNDVYHAANGQNSTFQTLVAVGGGGGGSAINTNTASIRNGRAGGSGGGGAGETLSNKSGGAGTSGQGFAGGGGSGDSSNSGRGGGGGGAGALGNTGLAGQGGNGKASDISGASVIYAGGGGGGNGNTSATSYAGGNGGGGRGGSTNTTALNGTPNLGGGGGGAGDGITSNSNITFSGADGGSGIIIIRWITASTPIFTGPRFDTLTAGLFETFTVTGTANSPLTRNYRWQVSTDTGTSWSNASTGSGFLTANYVTPMLETTTSGIRYQYRVVVTDSDTAGLFIVDTSTAVYLMINPRNTITSSTGSSIFTQKYGESRTAVFTFAFGTGLRTPSVLSTVNNQNGKIEWSNLNSDSATVRITTGLPVGTYYETLTVTDSVTATTSQGIRITVSKADTITVTTTLSNSTVTYNELPADVTVTQTVTGLVNSETMTVATTYLDLTPCASGGPCKIGDVAPGGGKVFYISATEINSATGISSGGKYLATAPTDWPTLAGIPTFNHQFGCYSQFFSGSTDTIGSGAANTRIISTSGCSGGAATVIGATINGFSDWFIPSLEELKIMRTNLYVPVPALASRSPLGTVFWSSVPDASNSSNSYVLYSGGTSSASLRANASGQSHAFMPIRAFNADSSASSTPTDAGTYRIGSTYSLSSPALLSNYQGIESVTATLTINKASQKPLLIAQYEAYPNISSYPLNVYGGSGPGILTRTRVSAGTSGCTLSASFILTATSVGSCTVKAEKAGTRNYLVESTTAVITWIAWSTNYATQPIGGNHSIPVNGGNQVIVRTETVTASAFSDINGNAITSASAGTTIRINSAGFAGLPPSQVFATFRPYEDAVVSAVTSTYVQVVVPSGATTGVISLDSPRGVAYTPSFTISP